jgi:hypothetical protein
MLALRECRAVGTDGSLELQGAPRRDPARSVLHRAVRSHLETDQRPSASAPICDGTRTVIDSGNTISTRSSLASTAELVSSSINAGLPFVADSLRARSTCPRLPLRRHPPSRSSLDRQLRSVHTLQPFASANRRALCPLRFHCSTRSAHVARDSLAMPREISRLGYSVSHATRRTDTVGEQIVPALRGQRQLGIPGSRLRSTHPHPVSLLREGPSRRSASAARSRIREQRPVGPSSSGSPATGWRAGIGERQPCRTSPTPHRERSPGAGWRRSPWCGAG